MRLNKFIASHSQFSRRKADELIENGKILINGVLTKKLGTQINPEKDKIKVNGKLISPHTTKVYFALNKPANFITTRSDDLKRKTVMDLVPKIPNLKPVGRLDKDTEGLLLLSNDGDFINKLTHPKFECKKEYYVIIKGLLTEKEKRLLEKGTRLEGKKTSPAKIKIIKESETQTILTIKIHQGRNRQIRKMFASISLPVKYLQRIKIGNISLGSLKKGSYRVLTNSEIYIK